MNCKILNLLILFFVSTSLMSCAKSNNNLDASKVNEERISLDPIDTQIQKKDIMTEKKDKFLFELLPNHELPSNIPFNGKLFDYKVWKDQNGFNYAVLSLTDVVENDNGEFSNTIYGYHFIKNPDETYTLKRKIQDFFRCEFEDNKHGLSIIKESFTITDLDENNYGEISFIYWFYCSMALSWADAKLMLLENGNKYPIRGTTYVPEYGDIEGNGVKKIGVEYNQVNKKIKDYAISLWDKFCTH